MKKKWIMKTNYGKAMKKACKREKKNKKDLVANLFVKRREGKSAKDVAETDQFTHINASA